MPIRWHARSQRRMGPQFITCPPNQTVCLLCQPHELAILELHWSEQDGGSFPCLGDGECPLCPRRKFLYAYGSALVWSHRASKWMQGILPIGDPQSMLAQDDLAGVPIIVGKSKEKEKRKRTICYGSVQDTSIPKPPVIQRFDVRPFLLRRWGLFKEADLIGCQFHPPQETLPFPTEETA